MKTNQVLFIISFCIVFAACQQNKRKDNARKVVNEWVGKEIKFPEGIPCQSIDNEVVCMDYTNKTYKVIAYTDSTGCTSCRLKLPDWKRVIAEADSLFPGKMDFIFFFQPKTRDLKELVHLLKRDKFDYPVFIDTENRINKLNHFPAEMEFQCFLLDSNNKVIMVGNPTLNPKVWELYRQEVGGEAAATPQQQTTIQVDMTQKYIKDMEVERIYTCSFEVENSGDYPFIILDIKASCGCTIPFWNRQPLAPSKKTEIIVEVKPETKGFFNKTIHVYGNAVNSPLKLSILGTVK